MIFRWEKLSSGKNKWWWLFRKVHGVGDLWEKLYTNAHRKTWNEGMPEQLSSILILTQQLADSNDLPINPD